MNSERQKNSNKYILSNLRKGDIVTYSTGKINIINKPFRYSEYFNDDMYNPIYKQQIVKIQRYKKVLFFYIKETIYSGESRWF